MKQYFIKIIDELPEKCTDCIFADGFVGATCNLPMTADGMKWLKSCKTKRHPIR